VGVVRPPGPGVAYPVLNIDEPDAEDTRGLVDMARLLLRMAKLIEHDHVIVTGDPATTLKELREKIS
jgi:hypothetical protein